MTPRVVAKYTPTALSFDDRSSHGSLATILPSEDGAVTLRTYWGGAEAAAASLPVIPPPAATDATSIAREAVCKTDRARTR